MPLFTYCNCCEKKTRHNKTKDNKICCTHCATIYSRDNNIKRKYNFDFVLNFFKEQKIKVNNL